MPVTGASDRIAEIASGLSPASVAAPTSIAGKLGITENMILTNLIKKYGNQIATGMYESIPKARAPFFQRALDTGANVKWSGPKQANVWNSILHQLVGTGNLKYATPSRYTKALQMLRGFEDHYMSLGHVPYSAAKASESVPLRLSDVIAKIGPKELAKHGDLVTPILRSSLSGGEMSAATKKIIEANPELARTVAQAVQDAKAGSAISEAPAVATGINSGKSFVQGAINDAIQSAGK